MTKESDFLQSVKFFVKVIGAPVCVGFQIGTPHIPVETRFRLKNGIVRRDYGIVRQDALSLKPKPLVVRSRDRSRDPGLLKKWHRSPRLWHFLPRLSALVTESEVTAQLLP